MRRDELGTSLLLWQLIFTIFGFLSAKWVFGVQAFPLNEWKLAKIAWPKPHVSISISISILISISININIANIVIIIVYSTSFLPLLWFHYLIIWFLLINPTWWRCHTFFLSHCNSSISFSTSIHQLSKKRQIEHFSSSILSEISF